MKVIDLPAKQTRVKVIQCPLVTAMKLAQEHNITIQFCEKCVHATKHMTCATIKYSLVKDKELAAIMAVEECLDKYNKLTGVH